MKLYVFTKKDIDYFLLECNFTPAEEQLFRMRCQEYPLRVLRRKVKRKHLHSQALKPPRERKNNKSMLKRKSPGITPGAF